MNTGIQDAHNLAWKIASVLGGITSASFLSTYEMERKPVFVSTSNLILVVLCSDFSHLLWNSLDCQF